MKIALVVMSVLTLVLGLVAYNKGVHMRALQQSGTMLKETLPFLLPLLVVAFVLAGFVRELVPEEVIARWVGAEGGLKGIFIGSAAGSVTPGGPYVTLPIAASFAKSGASVGIVVAFMTAWSLWAVGRLPMELGILGPRITLIRILSTAIFPPIAGLLAVLIDRWLPGPGG
ncbi:MAG: permease [Armatimonadota bacterium]|jgi:uncharacterized membrane protein YraQ (UPF0718 family)